MMLLNRESVGDKFLLRIAYFTPYSAMHTQRLQIPQRVVCCKSNVKSAWFWLLAYGGNQVGKAATHNRRPARDIGAETAI